MDILVQTPVDEGEDYDPKTDDLPPEAPTPAAQNVFTRRPAGVRLPESFPSTLGVRDVEYDPFRVMFESAARSNMFSGMAASWAYSRAIRYAEEEQAGSYVEDANDISPYAARYPLEYEGLHTRKGIRIKDQQIDRDLKSSEVVRSDGFWSTIGAIGGASIDPLQVLVPFARFKRGVGFVEGARRGVTPTFTATLIDEAILADHQPTRSIDEAAAIVAMSTGVVALLSGITGAFGRGYADRITKQYLDDIEEFEYGQRGETPPNRPRDDGDADFFDFDDLPTQQTTAAERAEGVATETARERKVKVVLRHAGPELEGGKLDLSFTGRANNPDSINPRMTSGISFSTKKGAHTAYASGRRQYEVIFSEKDLSGVVDFFTKVRDLPPDQRQAIVELLGRTSSGVMDGESVGNAISRIRNDIENGTDLLVERGISGFNKKSVQEIVIWDQKLLDNAELLDVTGGERVQLRQGSGSSAARFVDPDDVAPTFRSAGSAVSDEGLAAKTPREERRGDALKSAYGIERLPDSPYKSNMKSPFNAVREETEGLIESPGTFQNKNFNLEATELSVETKIRPWNAKLSIVIQEMTDQFGLYRGSDFGGTAKGRVIGLAKMGISDRVRGASKNKMSYSDFRSEVSTALRNNEEHDNPFVQKAAQQVRALLNELRDEAIDADLFTAAQRSKLKSITGEREQVVALQNELTDKIRLKQQELQANRINIELKHGKRAKHNAKVWDAHDKKSAALSKMVERSIVLKKRITGFSKKTVDLEEEIDRIREEGPIVFNGKGYVPRVWRIDQIDAYPKEFRTIVEEYLTGLGVLGRDLETEATKFIERIRRDHNYNPIKEFDEGIARSARERVFDVDDFAVAKFIENDIEVILKHHVRTFATDLELVKRFGTVDMFDQFKRIKEEGAELINRAKTPEEAFKLRKILSKDLMRLAALRDRLRGTYGLPADPYRPLSRFYRVMKEWNYLTYLGGVVLSAAPDLMRPIMVEGIMRTMRPTFASLHAGKAIRQLSAKETHTSGTGLDMTNNARALQMADLGDVFGRQSGIEKTLHNTAEAFSMLNLLNPWNAAVKEWTGMIIAARIFESADLLSRAKMGDFFPKKFPAGTWGMNGTFKTGSKTGLTVFHGSGGSSKVAVDSNVLGPAHYTTPDPATAKLYGSNVKKTNTFMENPYVIRNDKDFQKLLDKYDIPLGKYDKSEFSRIKLNQLLLDIKDARELIGFKGKEGQRILDLQIQEDIKRVFKEISDFNQAHSVKDVGEQLNRSLKADGYDGVIVDIGIDAKGMKAAQTRRSRDLKGGEKKEEWVVRTTLDRYEGSTVSRVFGSDQAIFLNGIPAGINITAKKIPHDFVKLARSGIDQKMARRLMKEFYQFGDIAFKNGPTMRDMIENSDIPLKGEQLKQFIRDMIERARKEGGVFLPNTDDWTDTVAVSHTRGAIAQDVDRTIVTPGAADKPLWMSTELGSVISQFKGFSVASAQRVLLSGLQEKQAYNMHGLIMLIGMGMMVDQLKREISGYNFGEDSLPGAILGGIDRSGVLGYVSDLDNIASALTDGATSLGGGQKKTSDRRLASAVGGPTASKFLDIQTIFSDAVNTRFDRTTGAALRRLVPFQNHFAVANGFTQIEQSLPTRRNQE